MLSKVELRAIDKQMDKYEEYLETLSPFYQKYSIYLMVAKTIFTLKMNREWKKYILLNLKLIKKGIKKSQDFS
jgi:hypothetical protein